MMNAASFYIMLLVAGRAIAIRTTDEGASLEQVNESWSWPRWGKRQQTSELRSALAKGMEAEKALTCFTITNYLIKQIEESGPILLNQESPDHDVENALTLQQVVISFVAAADRRKCLNEVMADPRVQKKLKLLLDAVPSFLHFPKTEMGRQRFQEAYLQLVSFQQGSLSLAANMSDRKMLLGADIRKGYQWLQSEAGEFTGRDCPEPCKKCDHYKAGSFGFRCLLKRADKNRMPQFADRSGMKCEEPKKRSWLRWYPFSRICEVADFKESALQHVHVSAMLACASATIVMGLQGDLTEARRQDMHNICVMVEQGQTISTEGQHQYSEQLKVYDLELSEKEKAHFGILLTWGMASGLAALRQASRGNERPASLLEEARELPFMAQCKQQAATLSDFRSVQNMQTAGWSMTNFVFDESEFGDDFKGACAVSENPAKMQVTLVGDGRLKLAVGNNCEKGSDEDSNKFVEILLNEEQIELLSPASPGSSAAVFVEFDYKDGDILSFSGFSGGVVVHSVSCAVEEPKLACDVASWPDVALEGKECGNCKVLVNHFAEYGTCDNYCAAVGRRCTAAWEDLADGCEVEFEMECSEALSSPDAICECGHVSAEVGAFKADLMTPEDYLAPFAAHLVNQSLRPQDLAMYGDQSLVEREQVLEQLDKCEEVWNLKLQNTFAEGTKPLSALGLEIANNVTDEGAKPCGKDCSPLKLLYGGVVSTAWVAMMSFLFIPVGLGQVLSTLYFGLIWVPITVWGLWRIGLYTMIAGDVLSSFHRLKLKESNLKGCMKSLKEAEEERNEEDE